MKPALFALLIFAGLSAPAGAAAMPVPVVASPPGRVILVDWQEPQLLPPRFRNHCNFENFTGRPYCSDHCGAGYQVYYCSQVSYGCCPLGRGYCDFDGRLRCHP